MTIQKKIGLSLVFLCNCLNLFSQEAFNLDQGVGERDRARTFFGGVAAQHGLPLALGVWHAPTEDNRIWFFDGNGDLAGEYRKTHLVPWLEDYAAGDGTLALVPFAGERLGGMICQDDNFTDVARGYGRAGVPLVAVPTNDWPAIRHVHFENSVFRAIENGYAVARAASAVISALVSARGEGLCALDHVGHAVVGSDDGRTRARGRCPLRRGDAAGRERPARRRRAGRLRALRRHADGALSLMFSYFPYCDDGTGSQTEVSINYKLSPAILSS